MDKKEYEIKEAQEWFENKNTRRVPIYSLLAEYGRRMYNQAINDAVNTVNRYDHHYTDSRVMKNDLGIKIKKLER